MNDDCTPNEQWELVFDMVDKEYLDKYLNFWISEYSER